MKPSAWKWLASYVKDLNMPSLSITANEKASQNVRARSQYCCTMSLATVSSGLPCLIMMELPAKVADREEKARSFPWSYNSLL